MMFSCPKTVIFDAERSIFDRKLIDLFHEEIRAFQRNSHFDQNLPI